MSESRRAALVDRLRQLGPETFWTVMLGMVVLAIYFASIGACGPWDPWETHYGEVARNIVAREDPMDLWWRPGYGPQGKREGVFASKHALPFWCMALSFKVFGVGTGAADEMVRSPIPEIALRLPSMLAGFATLAALGWCVGRLVHWRAGVLTAAALATMPQFAILTRQAVTDMFFVGPVALAMVAWAMAWLEPERELKTVGKGWREVPMDRAWWVFFALFVVAAVVPLAVMHLHVVDADTIAKVTRWNRKKTATLADLHEVARTLWIYWGLIAVVLVRALRWRRRSQAWMGVVYIAGGLSLMGKGMIGPGIIGLLILMHMLVSGRLSLLWRGRCELAIGVVLFVVTCFPWHHAMAIFRGERWVNELIVVNNLARFASGEQDQAVGGFGFYLRTLGLAALPWSAVVPPALWAAMRAFRRRELEPGDGELAVDASGRPLDSARELHRLATLWFIVSFGLITYSVTKYYHYLVPCLPPLAALVGLWLHQLLPPPKPAKEDGQAEEAREVPAPSEGLGLPLGAVLAFALGGCAIAFMVVRECLEEPAWIAHLTTYLYTGMWRKGAAPVGRMIWCVAPFVVGLLLWIARQGRAAVAAMVLSGLLTTAWVIDDYLPATSENWSQRTAMRYVFDHAEKGDKLLSWWFYYRGETYFSKRRIWVSMEPNRKELREFVDDHRGKGSTFWVMTTVRHAERAPAHFPADLRPGIEVVYENFHYALMRVPVP
ncbi:dolichyl-phosphate-mannose-protein mannosyltransferase family protein [Plesiocystis pacifica SIR-1]|uniref:Dolichyl-phosphate-mannose-protein mannosyltransferase family protein n=1 Tax=Plesiocystis pacifica SIR-1 TaxID=391625 RepID=A6G2Y2_9BACT|nr:dolichyl-phosphate-mannose--protein mannosyltransferase [Plesiocystis pacifica]EDM79832.1 dolichyl-phosphate-mannose-protein mannosyltransferase family protein [Plesiocystis pacifica SIR-1]